MSLMSKCRQITISNTHVTEMHEGTFSPTFVNRKRRLLEGAMPRQLSANSNVNRRRQSEKKGNAK